jgi:hypothetical protein
MGHAGTQRWGAMILQAALKMEVIEVTTCTLLHWVQSNAHIEVTTSTLLHWVQSNAHIEVTTCTLLHWVQSNDHIAFIFTGFIFPKFFSCFWRDNVFGLGVLMENKGEILHCNMGKRNCQIWCARIRGVSPVTPLLGNARNAAVIAAVDR